MAKKAVMQVFVLLMGLGALLAVMQLLTFGGLVGLTGNVVAVDTAEESEELPDFAVIYSEVADDTLVIDYYPGAYIGEREEATLVYEVVASNDEVITSGSEEISLDVGFKEQFLLEIPGSELPEEYGIVLRLVDSGTEEILEQVEAVSG